MNLLDVIPAAAVSGIVAYALTRVFSIRFKKMGMTGLDIHKPDTPETAEMGGLAVILALIPGAVTLVLLGLPVGNSVLLPLATFVLVGFVGVLDDALGLRQRVKPLLIVLASLPMMYLLIGRATISFPIIGTVPLGLLYPLIVVPVSISTAANFSNLLAGFNGLEAGIATIALVTISALAWFNGAVEVGALGFVLSASYLGFLLLNWYPARIFPGDTGTLLYGAALAAIGLAGGVETAAIILSIPAAMDFTLKMVSRRPFQGRKDYGNSKVGSDGVLTPPPYPALAHAFMNVERLSERGLVVSLLALELFYAALAVTAQSWLVWI